MSNQGSLGRSVDIVNVTVAPSPAARGDGCPVRHRPSESGRSGGKTGEIGGDMLYAFSRSLSLSGKTGGFDRAALWQEGGFLVSGQAGARWSSFRPIGRLGWCSKTR